MQTTIRRATHDDLDHLLRAAEAMYMESPRYSKLRFAAPKVRQLFGTLIDS